VLSLCVCLSVCLNVVSWWCDWSDWGQVHALKQQVAAAGSHSAESQVSLCLFLLFSPW
jgi:hypothetical protein